MSIRAERPESGDATESPAGLERVPPGTPPDPGPKLPIAEVVGRMIRSDFMVEFSHCDPFGHMTTTAYLDAAVNHRISAVRDVLGVDTVQMAKDTDVTFITRHIHLDLRRSAYLGDRLEVHSWVDEVKRAQMKVCVRISHAENHRVHCEILLDVVTVNLKSGFPVSIPNLVPMEGAHDLQALPWAKGHPRK